MKKSHIFWNAVIVCLMLLIPTIWMEDYLDILTGILAFNSFFLIALLADGGDNDDDFQPLFFYFSCIGFLLIGFMGIILTFVWLYERRIIKNFIGGVGRKIRNFNDKLDGKK